MIQIKIKKKKLTLLEELTENESKFMWGDMFYILEDKNNYLRVLKECITEEVITQKDADSLQQMIYSSDLENFNLAKEIINHKLNL